MQRKNSASTLLIAGALALLLCGNAMADKPRSPIKKTLSGECLKPDHPEYWNTKIYIAKPTVEACIASGGQLIASNEQPVQAKR